MQQKLCSVYEVSVKRAESANMSRTYVEELMRSNVPMRVRYMRRQVQIGVLARVRYTARTQADEGTRAKLLSDARECCCNCSVMLDALQSSDSS